MAAIIYVVFALVWGDLAWLLVESGGVIVFGRFAWGAHRFCYHLLALGWLCHTGWDVGLHLLGPGHTVAPHWYVLACLSFDVVVAIYIFKQAGEWVAAAEGNALGQI